MAYEYFISYRRCNDGVQKAREIYGLLTREVSSDAVFWDLQSIIGGRWWPQIEEAIRQAKHFIVLVDKGFTKYVAPENLSEELSNFPEKERASMNDWFFNEITLAKESECEIHPIVYDKDAFDKDACVKFQFFKQFQKLDGKDKDFDFELLRHLGIKSQKYEHFLVNNLNAVPSTFEDRTDLTKMLFDNIKANDVPVNFYGIGGVGKTTIVQQCVMSDYKNEFGSVVYVPVDNSVLSDYVNFFEDYLLDKGGDNIDSESKSKLKHKADDFPTLKKILEKHCTAKGLINIIIFDVNNNNKDDKSRDVLFNERNKIVPDGWKLLIVSHSKCNSSKVFDMELSSINNSEFAEALFDKLCDNNDLTSERKDLLLKNLFYSPLLISIVAGRINNSLNVKRILKNFGSENVSHEGHNEALCKYLKKLVSFKALDFNQKIIVSLFMVWPSRFIRDSVVCSFVRGYKFMVQFPFPRKVVCHPNDFAIKDTYKVNDKANVQFQKALDTLVNYNILVKSGSSYMMHAMLADELRGQFHNLVDNQKLASWFYWFRYFRGVLQYDHQNYIKRSKNILGEITKKHINDNDYIECLAHSIPLLKDVDNKYAEPSYFKYFEDNDVIKSYLDERKFVLNLANETDFNKLFDIHVEFGDFYKRKHNSLSAIDQYTKAIDLYEKNNNAVDHTKAVALYLKRAEFFDDFNVDYFKKAVAVFSTYKSKCHLDDYYGKLIEVMPEGCEGVGIDDNVTADFYYCLAKFYDNLYWQKQNRKTVSEYEVRAKRCFKKADVIWASLDTESEGELKGFVKTSYGFYDKKFGFKFVKVEGGRFDMGLSMVEWKKCHENVKLEHNAYLIGTRREPNSDSYYDYKEKGGHFSDEIPSHSVEVSGYYMATCQVTNKQWREVMGMDSWRKVKEDGNGQSLKYYEGSNALKIDGDYDKDGKDSYYGNNPSSYYDRCAMNYVCFYDAVVFCNRLSELYRLESVYTIEKNDEGEVISVKVDEDKYGFRLPTEAEWEFAARGGSLNSKTIYSGAEFCYDVAHYDSEYDPVNPQKMRTLSKKDNVIYGNGPQPVGILKPNSLGIFDMSGNVYEWCQDWYNSGFYGKCKVSLDPCCDELENVSLATGYSGSLRVLRGGSWFSSARGCRVSDRSNYLPAYRYFNDGLRLLLSSPKKQEKN